MSLLILTHYRALNPLRGHEKCNDICNTLNKRKSPITTSLAATMSLQSKCNISHQLPGLAGGMVVEEVFTYCCNTSKKFSLPSQVGCQGLLACPSACLRSVLLPPRVDSSLFLPSLIASLALPCVYAGGEGWMWVVDGVGGVG
ncbi:hypothetical protein Pmani_020398 [Petrolisthes manimaculis]|uniref:Uncharacterized protein n=1 Tax=Petrolisthes manimaculis TaxID=1843537 RepID=A0AAE1PHQ7_9EUCA|nr:hypothetical protein Pmani_020398 [Petrolisthes manimaculis]